MNASLLHPIDFSLSREPGVPLRIWLERLNEPLGDNPAKRIRKCLHVYPHVNQTCDSHCRVVGVHSSEHQMASICGLDGNHRCLYVTDFANQNYLRCLTKRSAQAILKRDVLIDIDLRDARDDFLHGVLERHDVHGPIIELLDRGIQCGALAGPCWTANQDDTIALPDKLLEAISCHRGHLDIIQSCHRFRIVHQATNDLLAGQRREDRNPHIKRPIIELEPQTSIQGLMAIGRCNVGTRTKLLVELLGQRVVKAVDVLQNSRNAVVNRKPVGFEVQVDVGGPPNGGLIEDPVQIFRRRAIMHSGAKEEIWFFQRHSDYFPQLKVGP